MEGPKSAWSETPAVRNGEHKSTDDSQKVGLRSFSEITGCAVETLSFHRSSNKTYWIQMLSEYSSKQNLVCCLNPYLNPPFTLKEDIFP